jgi:hypothetical protein
LEAVYVPKIRSKADEATTNSRFASENCIILFNIVRQINVRDHEPEEFLKQQTA